MTRLRADGLRFRLTGTLVLVAAVPLLVIGLLGSALGLGALRRETETQNLELARAIAGEVGRALERERWELTEVAGHVERELPGADASTLVRALTQGRGANPNIAQVYLLDPRGRVVAVSPPDPDSHGTDLSRLPYVAAAMSSRGITWSSATVLMATGEPRVGLVVPRAEGMLLAYLDLSRLIGAVSGGDPGPRTRWVALLDREGTFLASEDRALARERMSMLDQPLVQRAVRGAEGTAEYAWQGRRYLGSAVPVATPGWVVVVAEPVEQAFAAVYRMRWLLAVTLIVALGASAVLGLLTTARLVRPIEALSTRAGEVAAGDYASASAPLPGVPVREITELARAFGEMAGKVRAREEALARSTRELRAIVENTLVGIVRTTADGTILFVNPGFLRIVGASRAEDLVGRPIQPFYGDSSLRESLLETVRTRGQVSNVELTLRGLDGRERHLLLNMAFDGDRLTSVAADVTDLRRAAADRERLEEELRHAQKMDAVGRLAGGVAHDFNNLLTAIVGFAGLLEDAVPAEGEDRQSLNGIRQAAGRAGHLTQSLLAFSRKQVLQRRKVDVGEIVLAVEKLLRRVIGEDVTLIVATPPEPLVVEADAGQLEQVLVNLAANARDAMPGGGTLGIALDGVELDARVARDCGLRRGGRFVRIVVADTGGGIPEELRHRIFEPFFTTKPAGKGTGLGLSIVDGIVRQHAGHVAVESEVGKGTSFSVLLEREDAPEQRPAPQPAAATPRGRETILLAEDEVLVRRAFRRTLERAGYTVVEAEDGQQAVERFSADPARFDLCLLDVVMPRRNGREAATAIHAIRPEIPILLASGYAADVLADRGHLRPDETFITKPVPPEELLARVGELLDAGRARRPA
ncbi:MAG: ATP-binding protein [Anaeromyxobacteraceae bacterium]